MAIDPVLAVGPYLDDEGVGGRNTLPCVASMPSKCPSESLRVSARRRAAQVTSCQVFCEWLCGHQATVR